MAHPYLDDDETVVLATENIRVRSIPYQALILTSKRILLVRMEGETISAEEFRIADLRSALVSQAAKDEPTLLLSYVTPRGDARRESIVFVPSPQKPRKDEVREWAKKLSDQLQPLPDEEIPLTPSTAPQKARPGTAPAAAEAGAKSGSAPDILARHERVSGFTFPDFTISDEPEKPRFSTKTVVIAGVAVILAVIVVAALAGIFTPQATPPQAAPAVTPAQAPVAESTTAVVTEFPTVAVPATPPPPAKLMVPQAGVWIRVEYAGNFTGTVGSGAVMKQVEDTGEHFYQQAITTGSVRAIVEKTDGSSDTLMVEIYKDGQVVTSGTTSKPYGDINLQIELTTPTPTLTPTSPP